MLGKLIKYEFKHTAKTMFTTFIVLAIATIMGSLALYRLDQAGMEEGTFFSIFSVIMIAVYVVAIIGIYCGDFIYLCCHYHKTMYSSQGYLTHTLPVAPIATFSVKILVFFIWMAVSTLLSILSVLVLFQIGTGGEFLRAFAGYSWEAFSEDVASLFGFSAGFLFFIGIVESIIAMLYYILFVTASMAIGQLFQKNRTAFSILAGFGLYMANQIISTIYLVINGYSTNAFMGGNARSFMLNIIGGSIAISIIFVAALYGICIYINKRKLNLE